MSADLSGTAWNLGSLAGISSMREVSMSTRLRPTPSSSSSSHGESSAYSSSSSPSVNSHEDEGYSLKPTAIPVASVQKKSRKYTKKIKPTFNEVDPLSTARNFNFRIWDIGIKHHHRYFLDDCVNPKTWEVNPSRTLFCIGCYIEIYFISSL